MAFTSLRAMSALPPNVTPLFDNDKMAAIACCMDPDALRVDSRAHTQNDTLDAARDLCNWVLRDCADELRVSSRDVGVPGGGDETKFPPVEVKLTSDAARRRALSRRNST